MFDYEKNIEYYNINAEKFAERTVSVDFEATQTRFLNKLSPGALILDFGCGSGRDTRYFLTNGYRVEATDGSPELCRMASEYTGVVSGFGRHREIRRNLGMFLDSPCAVQ